MLTGRLINIGRTKKYIDIFLSEQEAARTYDLYAIALKGVKAGLNFDYTVEEMIAMIDHYLNHRKIEPILQDGAEEKYSPFGFFSVTNIFFLSLSEVHANRGKIKHKKHLIIMHIKLCCKITSFEYFYPQFPLQIT
ncbi:unnamed protein product [Moneuplotes crassus]|uniref:Uncharacterized protein n=1 Tax=Euplotes crassus TaxID=5936 RepID=A0AAD2D9H0_EUPCR|nr:unnamed protein product [Moneuplotes crassus]